MDHQPIPPINMASRFAVELEKLDPDIPFRASQTHTHYTWARTFYSRPEIYVQPQTLPEIQKIITLARRMRRRVVTVGCAHSPSELTCTSAWMVNLDDYNGVLKVDKEKKTITVEAGIRLHALNLKAKEHGLTMRNLGSIDEQSVAGVIATATHGSSMYHGLVSQSVRSLRIVLANGQAVKCSKDHNEELFRAALVSLGALGIIVEVEFEMVEARDIEWIQTILPTSQILEDWNKQLWTQSEFVRVWWLPYMQRAIVWRADETISPPRKPEYNWYGGSMGYHTYHILLWMAQYVPRLLPSIEWFVFGMQYGFRTGYVISAVEEQRTGLLMNCLYSQFVNEWALPLQKGPEALTRLTAWIHGDKETANIPFDSKGVYVHSPIEVRVSDTSKSAAPRPYLDNTVSDGPTLYLNATLYRPYGQDPPCLERYYEAFEWLMREMGGKPHWAKNFTKAVDHAFLAEAYGDQLDEYLRVRSEVDAEGMFVGHWHRRTILPPKSEFPALPLEEKEVITRQRRKGGVDWVGEQARWWDGGLDATSRSGRSESEESFDLMAGAEAEASVLLESMRLDREDDEKVESRGHARALGEGESGTTPEGVFDKM